MTPLARQLATLGVLCGSFLAAVEATVVSTAMPTVVDHLGGLAHYSWVFSAYILASTVTMPLWGKGSDLYGHRPFYLASIAIFLLGSALSGAAQSMSQLIVCRAIQGLGAGGVVPIGMTILGDLYTLEERARKQGLFSSVWGIASVIGPLVGGGITQVLSWRWVFYLNLPFGAVAAALVFASLPSIERTSRPIIDYRGAILMIVSLVAVMLALGQTGVQAPVLTPVQITALYALAAAAGVAFVLNERRAAEPIIPMQLLQHRLIGAATICGFLLGVAMFGALSFVPLFVQSVVGATATQAGSVLTPLLLGWVSMAIVAPRILPRFGYRPIILTGLVLVTLGFLTLLRAGPGSRIASLYFDMTLMGLGMGLTTMSLLLAVQHAVERSQLGVATSLAIFTRSIGGAVGVAVMGAVVAAGLPSDQTPDPVAMERALHRTFFLGAVVSAFALVMARNIPRGAPAVATIIPATQSAPASRPSSSEHDLA